MAVSTSLKRAASARLREESSDAQAHRLQHHVTGRLLRGAGERRHGHALRRGLRRLQRRTARAADTLLLGRRSYVGFKGYWPPVADDIDVRPFEREISRLDNAIDKVVISDTLTPEQTVPWADTTRIVARVDAREQIAELKRRPGKEILVFGSRTVWHNLLAAGLVDELHLMIGPAVLGRGGAGKSTAAARLGVILGVPVLELDTYFWSPDLTPRPRQEWIETQQRLAAGDRWVMDGDLGPYDALDTRLAAADTVLVLASPCSAACGASSDARRSGRISGGGWCCGDGEAAPG